MSYVVHRPLLSDVQELRKAGQHDWSMGPPDFGPLLAAWNRLERDLIARLSQRLLFIRGVPLKPRRGNRHEPIPAVWAASFKMNFTDNTITVDDDLYGAVEVSRTEPAVPAAMADPPNAAQPPVPPTVRPDVAGDADGNMESPGSRRPGPGSFDGMIDQAIERHWGELSAAVARLGKNSPNWSELARVLRRQMEKENRSGTGIKLPSHQVTRKRLAKQYPKHLVRMSGEA